MAPFSLTSLMVGIIERIVKKQGCYEFQKQDIPLFIMCMFICSAGYFISSFMEKVKGFSEEKCIFQKHIFVILYKIAMIFYSVWATIF